MASHREGLGCHGKLNLYLPDIGHLVRNFLTLSKISSAVRRWLAVLPDARPAFRAASREHAERFAADPAFERQIAAKCDRRSGDEAAKSLEADRTEELERMRLAFYGFDRSYHVARWRFITREPIARTPLHLARHRSVSRARR